MPRTSSKGRLGDVVSEHRQPTVTIPSLVLMLQADRMAKDVEQIVCRIRNLDYLPMHAYGPTATTPVGGTGDRSNREVHIVRMPCRPLHEPKHGLRVPGANRLQDLESLPLRHVVVNDVGDDSVRPETRRTVGAIARRHRASHDLFGRLEDNFVPGANRQAIDDSGRLLRPGDRRGSHAWFILRMRAESDKRDQDKPCKRPHCSLPRPSSGLTSTSHPASPISRSLMSRSTTRWNA